LRIQRRSDGTISLQGVRFEVPSHLKHCHKLWIRYRRWDMSSASVVDNRDHKKILAHIQPIDKTKNADGNRRSLEVQAPPIGKTSENQYPPLLGKMLADYAATGLPPSYIPHDDEVLHE
jgi:putative transposase